MKEKTINCPECGGQMEWNEKEDVWICLECGLELDEEW